ncbi:hypothetical protein GJ700_07380 [Duganella sp. FT92W]|uniref:HAMP domain-containing protein n=1 Tax=Pseudoduganella rivuli TaxID=2666085 RepID=A0A7X2IKK0_9BURK|nr:hypothetical protein [Pseudoduganella rivuli]MRV71544.1 hypothetical protein [Pseudoduganella rivuli]
MSRLSVTITAPIILISVLAVALTVFLNIGKLDRTLTELEDSRLRFTVNALRDNLETGLDLGLPVNGLGNAQAAIDFEAAQDAGIVAIIVRDPAGVPVYATGRTPDKQDIRVASPLSNDLGVTAGSVELHYSRRAHDAFMSGITGQLLEAAALATLLTGVLAALGIRLWVRRIHRTLGTIEQAFDPRAPAVEKPDRQAAELALEVNRTAGQAGRDLQEARAALSGPDAAGARL